MRQAQDLIRSSHILNLAPAAASISTTSTTEVATTPSGCRRIATATRVSTALLAGLLALPREGFSADIPKRRFHRIWLAVVILTVISIAPVDGCFLKSPTSAGSFYGPISPEWTGRWI